MSIFYAKRSYAEIEADLQRAARAVLDKAAHAAIMGPHTAPGLEHNSRLEMLMAPVEDEVYNSPEYKDRIEPTAVMRNRDACLGTLYRAINNGQMSEQLALQVYREACRAEAESLTARVTTGAALCRERIKAIIPMSEMNSNCRYRLYNKRFTII